MALRLRLCGLLALLLAPFGGALADPAPFDLAGPDLAVSVTRGGVALPVTQTPNLSPGDQLSVRALLPASESVRYLLVVAFLRGATNPPPPQWFSRADTWTAKGKAGVRVVVPAEAQQVMVFLAPTTGGDFRTLVDAVRGRPGAFVRASQDLNQAALDRSRLDAYLQAIRRTDPVDPDRLKTVSPLLARSLAVKLNADCLQKSPDLQAPCLQQGGDALILNDGHSTSIVEALTNGPSSDLALQLSAGPEAHFGYYSPYVAAAFDVARILDSFRTAQFQYLPALPLADGDRLGLLLNAAPSFHSPLSVLVTALPAVEAAQAPPLQAVDAKALYCAERTDLVLPVDGAPLAYSTGYAHGLTLRVEAKDGRTIDLPVHADAEKGGLVADTAGFAPADLPPIMDARLHGMWGFQPFDGPAFRLKRAEPASWRLAADDGAALIVGREDTVRLDGDAAACVQHVDLRGPGETVRPVDFKPQGPGAIAVTLPLGEAEPGPATLFVHQYGLKDADAVPLQTYAQAGKLDGFVLHAGDVAGMLKGARLDEVAGLTLDGVAFQPGALTSSGGQDELVMTASDPTAVGDRFKAGETLTARVLRKDGRRSNLRLTVAAARPNATLIGRNVSERAAAGALPVRLADDGDLTPDARLTFSLRLVPPSHFGPDDAVEVATVDGSASAKLTAGHGLTLADPQVALATLVPGEALGPSAFGPLRYRLVASNGVGDWRPLANLVRLPLLKGVHCPKETAQPCRLAGADLFLIDAVADEPGFQHPLKVPEGFTGDSVAAPRPWSGRLYLRLHDDPAAVAEVTSPG